MVGNLWKARKKWDHLSRILVREGGNVRLSGMFFKEVVKVVLLFGSEMRVMTPSIGQALGGFQHRVSRLITGKQPRRIQNVSWE